MPVRYRNRVSAIVHSSLFTHKKKPLCPPRYRWISPGTQKKEEQKALNPPHRDFSECKFITFSPNDKETKPEIAHYYIFTISPSSLSIFFHPPFIPHPFFSSHSSFQKSPRVRRVTSGYKLEAADIISITLRLLIFLSFVNYQIFFTISTAPFLLSSSHFFA